MDDSVTGSPPDNAGLKSDRQLTRSIAGQAVGHLASIGWLILAARKSSPDQFGDFSLRLAIILLLQVIMSIGLPQGIVRFGSGLSSGRAFRSLMWIGVWVPVLSVLVLAPVYLSVRAVSGPHGSILALLGNPLLWTASLAGSLILTTSALRQAAGRPGDATLWSMTATPALMMVGVAVIPRLDQPNVLLTLYAVACSSVAIASVLDVLIHGIDTRKRPRGPETVSRGELFGFSFRALGTAVVYAGFAQMDRVVLGALSTSTELAIYTVYARMARVVLVLVYFFPPLVGPLFASCSTKRELEQLRTLYRSATSVLISAAAPIAVLLGVFGAYIAGAAAGPDYARAPAVLWVQLAGILILCVSGNASLLIQMSGHERIELGFSVAGLAFSLVLGIWLVPIYGAIGAAIATSTSVAVTVVGRVITTHRVLDVVPPWRHVLLSLVSGAGLGGVLVFGRPLGQSAIWALLFFTCAGYVAIVKPHARARDFVAAWKQAMQ